MAEVGVSVYVWLFPMAAAAREYCQWLFGIELHATAAGPVRPKSLHVVRVRSEYLELNHVAKQRWISVIIGGMDLLVK